MIENIYLMGLAICIKVSIVIGIIFFILITLLSFFRDDNLQDKILGVAFFVFPLSFGVSISSFLLIYPVFNLTLQSFLTLEFYITETSEGTLGLRITSVLLGFNFLKSIYNFFANKLSKQSKEFIANYPDIGDISPLIDNTGMSIIILSQNLIYGSVTLLLWIFTFLPKSFLEIRLVTWALFFIIDDWDLISDNLVALKGRILRLHKLRIIFFNCLLLIFTAFTCFRELDTLIFSASITLILLILIILNATFFFKIRTKPE